MSPSSNSCTLTIVYNQKGPCPYPEHTCDYAIFYLLSQRLVDNEQHHEPLMATWKFSNLSRCISRLIKAPPITYQKTDVTVAIHNESTIESLALCTYKSTFLHPIVHSIIIHMLTYPIPLSLSCSQRAHAKDKRKQSTSKGLVTEYKTFTFNMVISRMWKQYQTSPQSPRIEESLWIIPQPLTRHNIHLSRCHVPQQITKEILDVFWPLLLRRRERTWPHVNRRIGSHSEALSAAISPNSKRPREHTESIAEYGRRISRSRTVICCTMWSCYCCSVAPLFSVVYVLSSPFFACSIDTVLSVWTTLNISSPSYCIYVVCTYDPETFLYHFMVITTWWLTVFLWCCDVCIFCGCHLSNCDHIHVIRSMNELTRCHVQQQTRKRWVKLLNANRN